MLTLPARLAARIAASGRAQWWAVFIPVLLAYAATLRRVAMSMSADPTGVTPSAWGMAHTGSPVIDDSQWPFFNPWYVTVGEDQVVSNRPPGLIYLATPFYWLFRSADTWEPLPGSVAAALVTAAAMATLGILVRRMIGPRAGWKVGLGVAYVAAFGTTTWAVSGTQLFPHGPDQLLLVLAMLSLAADRRVRSSVGAGLAFGAAVLIRPPLALVAAALGLARSWRQRSVLPAVLIGVLTALGLAAFAWYSHRYWNIVVAPAGDGAAQTTSRGVLNSTATHGYGDRLTDWSLAALGVLPEKIVGVLVSPGRGILVGAPFLLLVLPGIRRGWRVAPDWVRAAAIGGVAYLLIQLKVEPFTGGRFFWSYRYPLETLTLCAPLLVLAWRRWTARRPRRRAWCAALVAVAIGLQTLGAMYFHGPYPDTPWTFDNLAAAVHNGGATAVVILTGSAVAAGILLWRGYRLAAPRPGKPAHAAERPVNGAANADSPAGQITTPTSEPSP